MSRFIGGPSRRSVLVGAALAALAFGVSVGLAKSGPSDLQVPAYFGNSRCPQVIGASLKKPISIARIERTKGTITIKGETHGAVPGKYEVQLWEVHRSGRIPTCRMVTVFNKEFGVDGSGDGNYGAFAFNSSQQRFEINLFNTDLGLNNFSLEFVIGSS